MSTESSTGMIMYIICRKACSFRNHCGVGEPRFTLSLLLALEGPSLKTGKHHLFHGS